MSNMIDYLLSTPNFFEGRYIKGVESLIFSQLSYLHFELFEQSLKLADITDEKVIDQLVERTWNEALNRKLITSLAKHPIWRHIQILDNQTQFDANSELQFSATTFKIAPDLYYIAFRGTNSTFVGWKEDFNLSYMNAIPSQTAAVAYVEHIISKYGGTHYLGGHSKGGNLAHYATGFVSEEIANHIKRSDSFDGPGIQVSMYDFPQLQLRKKKLLKFIPENSVIGRIFDFEEKNIVIVKSTAKLIFEHDLYTWLIQDGQFVCVDKASSMSHFVSETIATLNNSLDDATKKECLDSLYTITQTLDGVYMADASSQWKKNIKLLVKGLKEATPSSKESWKQVAKTFGQAGLSHHKTLFIK